LSGRIGAQILYFVGVGRGKGRVLEQEHNDARRRLECSQVAEMVEIELLRVAQGKTARGWLRFVGGPLRQSGTTPYQGRVYSVEGAGNYWGYARCLWVG
jgi:hypothetical protein